ncbi:MAG: hypothetical protein M3Z16_05190 [Pseudomonadota bacterium]|nr:hypothetical protein [Pseudomonadota bacterium]
MSAITKNVWRVAALTLAGSALVAACGGSNDNNGGTITVTPAVTEKVPASASASAAGFIIYLQQLVVAFADLLEPVDTSAVTAPPADETSEPTTPI